MGTDLGRTSPSYAPKGKEIVTGKDVGDFDFLAGDWHIRHKRLEDGTKDIRRHFESSATVHRMLGGMGSIEDLRKWAGARTRAACRTNAGKLHGDGSCVRQFAANTAKAERCRYVGY